MKINMGSDEELTAEIARRKATGWIPPPWYDLNAGLPEPVVARDLGDIFPGRDDNGNLFEALTTEFKINGELLGYSQIDRLLIEQGKSSRRDMDLVMVRKLLAKRAQSEIKSVTFVPRPTDSDLAADYRKRMEIILLPVVNLINEANAAGLNLGFNIGRDHMGRNRVTEIQIFRPL